jgi:hypothetical protein
MDENVKTSWENFLNPDLLKDRLLTAAMFISAFEILKDSIIERIKDFYTQGFDENVMITSPDYPKKVLILNKSPLYASLAWLENSGAINSDDIASFEDLKKCRNTLAHRLFENIASNNLPDLPALFDSMIKLLRKIEVWWIVEVEIPVNPDYDGKEINEDEIMPGPLMILKMMIDIALGEGEQSSFYFKSFKKQTDNMTGERAFE